MTTAMTTLTDATHAPTLRSWVESANVSGCDFPIQNLPFGRFRRGSGDAWRIGVAIGDRVLDLAAALRAGEWTAQARAWMEPLAAGELNPFMGQPQATRRALRAALSAALAAGSAQRSALQECLVRQSAIELSLPCITSDYTDFYTGIHHAIAVGKLFRPDEPLLPNYRWVPIGYHGRSSSIGVSGQRLPRPRGQTRSSGPAPHFGPSQRLDYELELGFLIGPGNPPGTPIPIDEAEEHLFGVTLLNDWSARDIQAWEYQPLGPFLAKNFGTTLSPWVVTMEALAPFRRPFTRAADEPAPLPYLDGEFNRAAGAFDISLEVWLLTEAMRRAGSGPQRLSSSNMAEAAYWTPAQLVAHHTVGGCNLRSGDLFGSGTMSGPRPEQAGTLLELSAGGTRPVTLTGGESRRFLEDGDTVILRGRCEGPGWVSIGLGEASGTILPAPA